MRDRFDFSIIRQIVFCGSVTLASIFFAGCAVKQSQPDAQPAVVAFAEPEHQYICVSDIYFGETTRAHTLSDGKTDVPVGQWLAKLSAARFWTDSALKARGNPQPTVTAGFAPGTGVRPAKGLRDVEVQVILQFQIMRPTGNAYYDTVGGRASAETIEVASMQALNQALERMESVLANAGICRQVQ
jgi:hypothetical protein